MRPWATPLLRLIMPRKNRLHRCNRSHRVHRTQTRNPLHRVNRLHRCNMGYRWYRIHRLLWLHPGYLNNR